MNLWLDDIRTPPTEFVWVHVRTVPECIRHMKRKMPFRLSLDNDLGQRQEGYEVLDWLEDRVQRFVWENKEVFIPHHIYVHSKNNVAKAKMNLVISRLWDLEFKYPELVRRVA